MATRNSGGRGGRERPRLILASRIDLCPVKESAKILGKKWHLVIVHRLLDKKMGFNELKEAVGDVSAKILSQSLQDLQKNDIVHRRVSSQAPIRVEYSLTEKGLGLRTVLMELYDWGRRWDVCHHGRAAEGDAAKESLTMLETGTTAAL